jgi:ADP-heptose:LPS heptosyltransferase
MRLKYILKSDLALGDIVVMTAAVRELHLQYPGKFLTDIRTHFPAVWENNPYITRLDDDDSKAKTIRCDYPLINHSNQRPYHFLHGYTQDLAKKLHVRLDLTKFHGDIHLRSEEKRWISQVHERTGFDTPFWVINAGGKFDYTIKWWRKESYQAVVDHFQGRILFVQVGDNQHYHPKLDHVLDLRGKTNVRQLIRLIHHSQGVLCPVTSLMHLAAAVETKHSNRKVRPCVVVAGGREPAHWEEYPGHQFLHTIGTLSCCANGGCWKSRTLPLGDGDLKDSVGGLCTKVVDSHPLCMSMIRPEQVIESIESYLAGDNWSPLSSWEADQVAGIVGWNARSVRFAQPKTDALENRGNWLPSHFSAINDQNAIFRTFSAAQKISLYPSRFSGRGIVICGGGLRYLPSVYINIKMLRAHGCRLPVELWHRAHEVPEAVRQLLEREGVTFRDASDKSLMTGAPKSGWELKSYSIVHTSFEEVLYLDADNMPVKDPTCLFETKEYLSTGAVFWPDYGRLACDDPVWSICGVDYLDEPEFESGQILVNKSKCWKALNLAHWYNENSAFFYKHFMGDKETFHLAFRFLKQPYAMTCHGIFNLSDAVMCQHDFDGQRLFQHRNRAKWKMFGENRSIPGFTGEKRCFKFLKQFRQNWDGRMEGQQRWDSSKASEGSLSLCMELIEHCWELHITGEKISRLQFMQDGTVSTESDKIIFWNIQTEAESSKLIFSNEERIVGELSKTSLNSWVGTFNLGARSVHASVSAWRNSEIPLSEIEDEVAAHEWLYIFKPGVRRLMHFGRRGEIANGAGNLESRWHIEERNSAVYLHLSDFKQINVSLRKQDRDLWQSDAAGDHRVELHKVLRLDKKSRRMSYLTTSRPTAIADISSQWYASICAILKEKPVYNRQQWELASIFAAARDILTPSSTVTVMSPQFNPLVDALASLRVKVNCFELVNRSVNNSHDDHWCRTLKSELSNRTVSQPDEFTKAVSLNMWPASIPPSLLEGQNPIVIMQGALSRFDEVLESTPGLLEYIGSVSTQALIVTGDVRLLAGDKVNAHFKVNEESLNKIEIMLREMGYKTKQNNQFGTSIIEHSADTRPYSPAQHIVINTGHAILTSYILIATRDKKD